MYMVLAVVVAIAVLADGLASGIGLVGIFGANNAFSSVVVFGVGFVMTGLVAVSGVVWRSGSPLLLKALWILAVGLDVYTTYLATVYYIVMGNPLSERVDVASVPGLITLLGGEVPVVIQNVLVLFLPLLLSGSTMLTEYVIDRTK